MPNSDLERSGGDALSPESFSRALATEVATAGDAIGFMDAVTAPTTALVDPTILALSRRIASVAVAAAPVAATEPTRSIVLGCIGFGYLAGRQAAEQFPDVTRPPDVEHDAVTIMHLLEDLDLEPFERALGQIAPRTLDRIVGPASERPLLLFVARRAMRVGLGLAFAEAVHASPTGVHHA